jgi:hypothetical protein
MKKRLLIFTFAISGALGLVGCYVERPHEEVRGPVGGASYSYVYYPDAEVYFEPHSHVYYWSEGGSWRSGPRAPGNIVLRSHVTVNLNSREPYTHHDEIRAKYPHEKRDERREEKQEDRSQR